MLGKSLIPISSHDDCLAKTPEIEMIDKPKQKLSCSSSDSGLAVTATSSNLFILLLFYSPILP